MGKGLGRVGGLPMMEVKNPLDGRAVVSRVGGVAHACSDCGSSLFFKNCVAVCIEPARVHPKFGYFCNEDHACHYVESHDLPEKPIEEESEEDE